jgi:hypothetical protein
MAHGTTGGVAALSRRRGGFNPLMGRKKYCRLAQSVEQVTVNHWVGVSNTSTAAKSWISSAIEQPPCKR